MTTQELREKVVAEKGRWKRIAKAANVPYDTLTKFASGKVQFPRSDTIDKLAEYFKAAA